jgi:predicted acyltransferase
MPSSSPSLNPSAKGNGEWTRLVSLDLFRGYAVLGMVIVNLVGSFKCTPRFLKHTNDYCSYADTIMPHFLFAVGFALQIVWKRETDKWNSSESNAATSFRYRITIRCLRLMILAFLVYVPLSPMLQGANWVSDTYWLAIFKRDWFQTLTHIAVTSIWVLPAISLGRKGKMLWMGLSVVVHAVLSQWFYFDWVHASPSGIDGGPLGFLTWGVPAITGMLACTSWTEHTQQFGLSNARALLGKWLLAAFGLMLVGYGLSCGTRQFDRDNVRVVETIRLAEPPFVPPPPRDQRVWNYWMMSQKAGTPSYQFFAAGFSLMVFAGFVWLCDVRNYGCPPLKTLGQNALVVYVLHGFIDSWIKTYVARDADAMQVVAALVVQIAILYAVARWLQYKRWFIRL